MIIGSYIRRGRRLTFFELYETNLLRLWPSLVWRLDHHKRQSHESERFLHLKHFLKRYFTKFGQKLRVWPEELSKCFSKLVITVTLCFENIWIFVEWKPQTLVQHLANLTNSKMYILYEGSKIKCNSKYMIKNGKEIEWNMSVYLTSLPSLPAGPRSPCSPSSPCSPGSPWIPGGPRLPSGPYYDKGYFIRYKSGM